MKDRLNQVWQRVRYAFAVDERHPDDLTPRCAGCRRPLPASDPHVIVEAGRRYCDQRCADDGLLDRL